MPEEDRGQKYWLDEIQRYTRASQEWRKDSKSIIDRYRLERQNIDSAGSRRPIFNVLWSNIQTMKPAIFSKVPQIIAERRHRDSDPIGRLGSQVLQRASNEEVERNGFKDTMDQVVLDVLLPGRGVPWVRFEVDDVPSENGEAAVANERIFMDYVHWEDFAHSPERNWAAVERVGWVARKTALTKREGTERFGEKFANVEMSMSSRSSESLDQRERSGDQSQVWRGLGNMGCGYEAPDLRSQGRWRHPRRARRPVWSDQFLPVPTASLLNCQQRRPVPNARLQAIHRPGGRTGRYPARESAS